MKNKINFQLWQEYRRLASYLLSSFLFIMILSRMQNLKYSSFFFSIVILGCSNFTLLRPSCVLALIKLATRFVKSD